MKKPDHRSGSFIPHPIEPAESRPSAWAGKQLWFVFLSTLAVLVGAHLPWLRMPYFWDEAGQFIPASFDLYRDGAWIAHTVRPNVHPPGVMALIALTWHIFGYSILPARIVMLVVASLGATASFALASRLAGDIPGAPVVAVLFLIASPVFYTQSMLVMLDMPAMTLTTLALILFLDRRYAWCAVSCTALVLAKETAITTPAVFAGWLLIREKRVRESLYFAAPALALGAWLTALHHATGHWLGNEEFANYNLAGTTDPVHLGITILERLRYLFWSDGHVIGTVALALGWRFLRRRAWAVAGLVALAQTLFVTAFGTPLIRYLLPVLPILYAAVATAAAFYPPRLRWASHIAMIALLVAGIFWNPPYPYAYENNLSMMDFTRLQQAAASYLEAHAADKRIATAWPLTDELRSPFLGYVTHPLNVVDTSAFRAEALAALDPRSFDLLVVYKRLAPATGTILDFQPVRRVLEHYYEYHPQATEQEVRATGLIPLKRWDRRGQWVVIYGRRSD